MNRLFRPISTVLIALILTGGGFTAGFLARDNLPVLPVALPLNPLSRGVDDQFRIFWEAWRIVEKDFVDKKALDPQKMTRGAIKGMLESLGDPHTTYVEPEIYKTEQADLFGSFQGIGAQVTMRNRQLVVIAPIEDSPAEKAGVRAGDRIFRIDDQDTSKMSLAEAVGKIRGSRGSKVRLSILHDGENKPVELEIVRGDIKLQSVSSRYLPDNIAYIRIAFVSQRTNDELIQALKEAQNRRVKGLVLDLRNNPGGLLDTTIDVASQFLKEGIVVYQVDGKGERTPYPVKSGGLAIDLPLALLVNKGTASAGEIIGGALQDARRAILIGEETFGKGSVNQFHSLSDGSAIYVTFARWITPKGHQIEGKGLSPDIEVAFTEDDANNDKDPQLDRATQYLNTGK
ncbi:MAG: S41 family peptidase [Chloroflexi bacterium]|nr:S41 family peptidase [Chloroflexota bacterium]